MKSSIGLMAMFAMSSAAAPTIEARAPALSDGEILNYALTLEHLEARFYRDGLANYSHADFVRAGFPDPFYARLQDIAADESAHVKFLTAALKTAGVPPVAECTYAFPATDPRSFVALSSVLEGVGVSAYLGAAADIMSRTYLTAAGSILTIEARHSAYMRLALGTRPFPAPFDAPLDPNEVYTLASAFMRACPRSNRALPLNAFPALALGTAGRIAPGQAITLLTPGYTLAPRSGAASLHAAFIAASGPVFAPVHPVPGGFGVAVPRAGIAGQSYVVLTRCTDAVTDDTVVAGPAVVEVGFP